MNVKNVFNVFLVSILVLVGVYFVVGTAPISLSVPDDNLDVSIYGNYTITFIIDNTNFSNVWNVSFFNTTDTTVFSGTSSSEINANNSLFNVSNSSGNIASFSAVIDVGNFTNGIWGRGDGNYTITAVLANSSNAVEYINLSFLVDSTPPNALTLVYPYMNETFVNNATIYFGFNVSDGMSGNGTYGNLLNCSLLIDGASINDSIKVLNTTLDTPVNNLTVTNINASYVMGVPATQIDSGDHTWNVTCYDGANNFNNTARFTGAIAAVYPDVAGGNFTITDTQGPTTGTPSLSATSVAKDASITITCTGTDLITADPVEYVSVKAPSGEWQEDLGTSPYLFTGTNAAGTWTTRCRSRDSTGNTGGYGSEATFSVTVASGANSGSGSGGGSGGSSSSVSVTALTGQTQSLGNLADSFNSEGIINAYQSSTVTFSVVSSSSTALGSHSIVFDNVDYINGEITITISSDPVTLTMSVGDVENVDVDSDGVDDIEITLNSIDSYGKANLNIKDLGASSSEGDGETGETGSGETTTTESSGLGIIWWILIIVVIVVIVVLVIPKKKK